MSTPVRHGLEERNLSYVLGLGLDHFEGRTWRGRHHHVTLVTAARAFLTLRRLDPAVPHAA